MAYENARAERDFRQNPPSNAPGQGSDDGWGDIFDSMPEGSSSAEQGVSDLYSTDINTTLNNYNSQNQNNNNLQQGYQAPKSTEDYIIDGTIAAGKGVFRYAKALFLSFKDNKEGDWHALGVRIVKNCIILSILGLIMTVVECFTQKGNSPMDLTIGSVLAMIVGVALCMWNDKDVVEGDTESFSNDYQDAFPTSDNYDFLFDDEPAGEESWQASEEEFIEEDESVWLSLLEDDSDSYSYSGSVVNNGDFSVEDALANVTEIAYGTQTRQYLYETFIKVLPTITPGFSEMLQVSEGSDIFFMFEDYLRSAAYQVGTKDESIPELETLYENDFIYRLNCSRPVGLKEQQIADEIASAFSRDDNNMEIRSGVYATVETTVGKFTINIFKGTAYGENGAITISLGDVYKQISSYVLNPKNIMPFVWGINEFGKPLYCDLINCDSIIISGEADGGKSWKGQSIVAQLSMFNSPKELEFYFFDHKNTASDYRYLAEALPHTKYFCGDPRRINDGIQTVIDTALTERSNMLDSAGCVNIKEYNQMNPQNKMPYMYVVVDELMSLMDYFALNDKDEQNRFKNLMSTAVSKLRYVGVRVILFPHRIVDSVIGKNTYSLVSSRAVVRQLNQEEIKNAMGVTKKEFPYSLVNKGDMAIKTKDIASGQAVFCHAEVLSTSNEGNKKLFDFIGGVWKKLEPDCECIKINGMIGGSLTKGVKANKGVTPPRDNTNGVSSFEYSGFNSGNSVYESDMSTGELDSNSSDLDADSEFWDLFGE